EMTAPKQTKKKKQQANDEKDEVIFDDFMKLDFRVAEITKADKVKKADKLLKLQVDLGKEKRQIVSGIAEIYTPEELVGKKVIVVAKLKPVQLVGKMTEGMILE